MWHLFHGRFTSFEERKIRVPWDCWVFRPENGGIVIERPAPQYSLLHSPGGQIVISRSPAGIGLDLSNGYNRIVNHLISSQESIGYKFQSVHRTSLGDKAGYCWEFLRSDSRVLSIFCWFDKDTLGVSFSGSPAYREKFYFVVAELTGHWPHDGN